MPLSFSMHVRCGPWRRRQQPKGPGLLSEPATTRHGECSDHRSVAIRRARPPDFQGPGRRTRRCRAAGSRRPCGRRRPGDPWSRGLVGMSGSRAHCGVGCLQSCVRFARPVDKQQGPLSTLRRYPRVARINHIYPGAILVR